MILLYIAIGTLLGCTLTGLFTYKKVKHTVQLNKEMDQYNQKLYTTNQELLEEEHKLFSSIRDLEYKKQILEQTIKHTEETTKEFTNNYLKSEMALAEEKFDRALENLSKDYAQAKEEYEKEYLVQMNELAKQFKKQMAETNSEIEFLDETLSDYKQKVHSIIETFKREEEEKSKERFYCVNLTQDDIDEVNKFREIGKSLRDKDLLNKIIWKGYYEKPCNLMCGRVVGANVKSGIYKITNLENHMSYIGQAVDIAARFKQHIKRGLGAEPQTRNKLYPAMYSLGVENFKFEILEECEREKLNDLERYWIDFYETQSYGYNVTKGGA